MKPGPGPTPVPSHDCSPAKLHEAGTVVSKDAVKPVDLALFRSYLVELAGAFATIYSTQDEDSFGNLRVLQNLEFGNTVAEAVAADANGGVLFVSLNSQYNGRIVVMYDSRSVPFKFVGEAEGPTLPSTASLTMTVAPTPSSLGKGYLLVGSGQQGSGHHCVSLTCVTVFPYSYDVARSMTPMKPIVSAYDGRLLI